MKRIPLETLKVAFQNMVEDHIRGGPATYIELRIDKVKCRKEFIEQEIDKWETSK